MSQDPIDPISSHSQEISSADPTSDRWRRLVTAAVDPVLTELWDCYTSDCRDRNTHTMPYTEFMRQASHLKHSELPEYWKIYLSNCYANDEFPEPFLSFVTRIQTSLTQDNLDGTNGRNGGFNRQ